MTMQFPVSDPAGVNAPLLDGPADWISPGSGVGPNDEQKPGGDWLADPPANDGHKVVISDTDHYAPYQGDGAVGVEVVPARAQPDSVRPRDHGRCETGRPHKQ